MGDSYSTFNPQFMWFSLTLALVQLMQHRYQSKLLYKQRALSKAATMATTTDLPTGNSLFQIIGALLCLYVGNPTHGLPPRGLCFFFLC